MSSSLSSSAMSGLAETLAKRDRCWWSYGRRYCNRSGWYYWGRWVLAGAALFIFLVLLLSCCLVARRRRRRGTKPYYGTGWMAPPPKYGAHQTDIPLNQPGGNWAGGNNYQNAPPNYTPAHQGQYTGTTFSSPNNDNADYYSPQQQYPPNTYQPDNLYPPPPAAPGPNPKY
ncbi:hypothetical protein ACRE_018420 [Hapsidospora chrysogenum ATCC 11550]|uniref:Uncharacterized protein n=1 Tax=Hapsidospora chrysogenum (strain ATCC 11550 / CBS 779.69 / DSM 880 / IAM 14645 / JCM 23072 / IMI 49137) TaxID=857340 RepID=A0A086TCY2_HAPC1|nr:hypothetical protein ACRE_018420 [Hapsidospora chrysogenum ATCC 11550]